MARSGASPLMLCVTPALSLLGDSDSCLRFDFLRTPLRECYGGACALRVEMSARMALTTPGTAPNAFKHASSFARERMSTVNAKAATGPVEFLLDKLVTAITFIPLSETARAQSASKPFRSMD